MNKKQLTFYALILTFGLACGEGSVKNSGRYKTHTPPQGDNAPKNNNHSKENKPTKDNHIKRNSSIGNNIKKCPRSMSDDEETDNGNTLSKKDDIQKKVPILTVGIPSKNDNTQKINNTTTVGNITQVNNPSQEYNFS